MSTNTAPGSQAVLLALAFKQVWPDVLAVAHLKLSRLVLLHSHDIQESEQPAERLRKFFAQQPLRASHKPDAELLSRRRRCRRMASRRIGETPRITRPNEPYHFCRTANQDYAFDPVLSRVRASAYDVERDTARLASFTSASSCSSEARPLSVSSTPANPPPRM